MARLKGKAHNLVDPELQKLFLVHRDAFAAAKAKVDKASNALRSLEKTIKGDGFTIQQIKDAILLSTPEGEAMLRAEIANRLLAAAYSSANIGDQLSLFLDHDRTPAVDKAFREGVERAMQNKTLETNKYAPGTDQYIAFCEGYHEEQERQVLKGIKKKEDAPAPQKGTKHGKKAEAAAPTTGKRRGRPPGRGKKAAGEAPAARAAKDDAPPRRPSARPVTRATLAAQQAEASDAEEGSYFSKSIN